MDTTIELVRMTLLDLPLVYGRERSRPCSRLMLNARRIIVKLPWALWAPRR